MTSLSRTLPRLAVAVLAIVVLAAGCRTGPQKSFHYSGVPGEGLVGPADLVVEVGEDCHVNLERVVLDTWATGKRDSHDQVLWLIHIEGGQPGDQVTISAKPAEKQDPSDPKKGREIRELLQVSYTVTSPDNAIPSGRPKKSLLFLKQHSVVWKYNVEYSRDGKPLCSYDPVICIQKPGTDSCSMTN